MIVDINSTELLKTAIFVEKTCKITFHIELKEAGGGYVKSKSMTEEILIPIYNIECESTVIRDWVINNNIIDDHYNDDVQLQEQILYKITDEYSASRF